MSYKELWLDKNYSHGPLLVLEISRNVIGIIIIGIWVDKLFSATVAILVAVPVIVIVLYLFSQKIKKFYQRIEGRFLINLNARELAEAEMALPENIISPHFQLQSQESAWDAHMVDLVVNQHANYIGKTLSELGWREQYGVNIAYIKRGDKLIYAPGRNNKLLPFDHVGIIATDEQMLQFKPIFDAKENIDGTEHNIEDIILQKIVVDEHNQLQGKTIRDSGIKERTNGLVVGIERDKERILNPTSATVFKWNDIVWIVGERKKIQKLNEPEKFKSPA